MGLLSFIGLSDHSVSAIPVEEDPQSYSSGANGGLSFSINSPRKTDAADQRNTQDQRSQQQRASNGDRKGIKVRLSDVMKQHMLWSFKDHSNDKARIQEAILGFPSDFVITESPQSIDPEVTEFVTNPSPNQGTKIEKPRNTQTKTKFRHPQQNRGR